MRLPGSYTPEPFPLDSPHTHTEPGHVPFQFTPGIPLAEPTPSHSPRQFIPAAGATRDGPSEEHPWAFIPSHSPLSPHASLYLLSFLLHPLSVSIHLTSHQLSSPCPKGWPPPRAQSAFPCAACRLSLLEEKRSSPALSCPAPWSPPTSGS